ncbi:MAG TPA: glycosyltransferase [Paracoccaceae bacterium]|nr:glycosyltransferase [Paracoccaceae bacterium]
MIARPAPHLLAPPKVAGAGPDNRPTISVVMPAYNAAAHLPRVLAPLLAMRERGEVEEVIVVDDRSSDATASLARQMGASVLVTLRNGGPGAARNLAAQHAAGDILWFVDSDVIAWPGGAALIRAAFAEPGVEAVFGSYDAAPDGTPWLSRYKNLVHRFYHQKAGREATTFWAGCGAVHTETFRRLGGFDVATSRLPSREDIELGYRIHDAGGRILVLPELLGKHLKVWTLRSAVQTDLFRRALPWSRLMIARARLTDDLNTARAERLRAGAPPAPAALAPLRSRRAGGEPCRCVPHAQPVRRRQSLALRFFPRDPRGPVLPARCARADRRVHRDHPPLFPLRWASRGHQGSAGRHRPVGGRPAPPIS